ncbi:MAG: hypothetical protein AB8B61_04990 [Cyclobacteriaceae bacterium]
MVQFEGHIFSLVFLQQGLVQSFAHVLFSSFLQQGFVQSFLHILLSSFLQQGLVQDESQLVFVESEAKQHALPLFLQQCVGVLSSVFSAGEEQEMIKPAKRI